MTARDLRHLPRLRPPLLALLPAPELKDENARQRCHPRLHPIRYHHLSHHRIRGRIHRYYGYCNHLH